MPFGYTTLWSTYHIIINVFRITCIKSYYTLHLLRSLFCASTQVSEPLIWSSLVRYSFVLLTGAVWWGICSVLFLRFLNNVSCYEPLEVFMSHGIWCVNWRGEEVGWGIHVIPPVGGVKVEYHFRIYMVVVSEIMFQCYNNERHWSAKPSAQQCMWMYLCVD